ncbi:hypothetical protein M431DRAFT_84830 [Trichoderma harzianum CBS 226.95]|uniref:Uncharacterized protein n=1 Tax=Trichoderma harzianum CBS 226.95 TaxID=983964 RepID=A0A2T4ADK1_TRIHA|nr:hypothetical protein M431DRAFT_84830 [Trichoderma harzianum CBS 226.95]PTB55149.1 hypothetical protein M431DRAFT_84830 [Trichoderma harzianum CBS 226.95]
MCAEYIVKCRYCGYWKHYSWDRCGENRMLLRQGCALGLPSQHPSECDMFPEDKRQRIKRQVTPYECPVQECKSTEIAAKLFEERAKVAAARAAALAKARAEWEAKDKARKAEFAARYFKKLPVVRFSERRESFLEASAASASQAIQNPQIAGFSGGEPYQWQDEQAQTLTDPMGKGKEIATSMHSQVFEDSDDDDIFSSASEEVELEDEMTAFSKYFGAIDIQGSGANKRKGRAVEFCDDGMPIRTITP